MLRNDVGRPILCDYCKTNPAIVEFKNGKYCCQKTFYKCQGWRDKISRGLNKRIITSKKQELQKEVDNGEHLCKYCDMTARFVISLYIPCCQPKAKLCPGFHTWLSNSRKDLYERRPELKTVMSKYMKEVHNRPEVKQKKKEAMLRLHNGDSNTCKEFQDNYQKGRKQYKETIKRRQNDEKR